MFGAALEEVEGEGSGVENFVVEGADVEAGAELVASFFAEFSDFELAEFVGESLTGVGDVAVGFGLGERLVDVVAEHVIDDLLAGPAHVVKAGVDDEADGAEEFRVEAAVVADGVLVEADLLAELFRVKCPALDVGGGAAAAEFSEARQAGEPLLNGELHVVAGNALMIGDGFVVDEGTLREVGGGDGDAAGVFAVGRAGLVVGAGGGLEGRDGFHGDGRFGQQAEELRQLGLHLRDVFAEIVKDLFGGGGSPLWIFGERGAEAGEVGEALLPGDVRLKRGDAGDLLQAEFVNLFRGQVSGGLVVDGGAVAAFAVGQAFDGECGAAVRGVVGLDEGGEGAVGGNDFVGDGGVDFRGEALLVRIGKAGGKLGQRQLEGVGGDEDVALRGDFGEQEVDGHEAVLLTGAQDVGRLLQGFGDGVQARDVIVVMLDGVEGHGAGQVRELGVGAALLVDGHLVILEGVTLVGALEGSFQQLVGEGVLLGHAVGGDAVEAGKKGVGRAVALRDGGEGEVGQQIVIAVVADGSGAGGKFAEAVLEVVVEELVLRVEALLCGGVGSRAGGCRSRSLSCARSGDQAGRDRQCHGCGNGEKAHDGVSVA